MKPRNLVEDLQLVQDRTILGRTGCVDAVPIHGAPRHDGVRDVVGQWVGLLRVNHDGSWAATARTCSTRCSSIDISLANRLNARLTA